jgi:hypothetical protein
MTAVVVATVALLHRLVVTYLSIIRVIDHRNLFYPQNVTPTLMMC